MLQSERHEKILQLLEENRLMTIRALASRLDISEVTIRRDIRDLDETGRLRRVRGGAEALSAQWDHSLAFFGQPPFAGRQNFHLKEKKKIAKRAVELCDEGETVIIDGGTTTFCMAEYLQDTRLQILTNSFAIARALMHTGNQIVLTGGMLYPEAELILDPFDAEMFSDYVPKKLFLGVAGMDESGVSNLNALILKAEKRMIARAEQLIILADSSKLGTRGSLSLCRINQVHTLITDSGITDKFAGILQKEGVNLIVV